MRLKLKSQKTVNKSGLVGYGRFEIISQDLEQFIGKKCLITGEIEITELKEV